ncbi:hypothetical protein PF003_g22378 [Phytophthora fragariae]|nr:hypothetical protein PF003_g22378 [Phytophthora fragariae]
MHPEKSRKLALVRKRVREADGMNAHRSAKRKRLTDPTERRRLQDRDDRFSHHETTDNDSDSESVSNPDRALEYWSEVLCELEGEDDPPVTPDDNSDHGNATQVDAAAAAAQAERRFNEKVKEIRTQSKESIPEQDQRPFPDFNDRQFPQEKVLAGLRGQKVTLAELSETSEMSSAQPGTSEQFSGHPFC